MSLMEQVTGGNTKYLKIIQGSFRQEVEEGTEGSKARTWEANGATGVKHEITWKNLKGFISDVKIDDVTFNDGNSMQVLKVTIENGGEKAQFSTQTNSRFGVDFMKKLPAIDPSKMITINPYDFEDSKGVRRTAFNIVQDGEKIYSYFWDNDKKKALHGIPVAKDTDDFDKDDWKMHFMKEKKFLVKNTQKIAANYVTVNEPETVSGGEDEGDDLPF